MTTADETAIAVLGWLAGEPELLGRFLALTGTDPSSLRGAVGDPGFMAGLLDFVMDHEPTLMQFCEDTGTKPETVARARCRFGLSRRYGQRMTIETIDPEAPLCFDHITLTDRPLIVCDVDEVVLEFVTPFQNFLRSGGRELLPRSFRLQGNIVHLESGEPVADAVVPGLLEDFFMAQDEWQTPALQAAETLADLSREADIVFLTAMPPRHTEVRRRLLDRHGLCDYPLLATEAPKGPVVKQLHDARDVPVAFIDDILRNLESVRDHAPDCLLIRLMANEEFLAMAPAPTPGIESALDWNDAARIIRQHFLR